MDISYYRIDVLTLGTFLSPILTVTTEWNTGETGDIKTKVQKVCHSDPHILVVSCQFSNEKPEQKSPARIEN